MPWTSMGAYACGVTSSTHYADAPGQRVEVTISPISSQVADQTRRYSLSGLKVEYEQPFESVAAAEWEATK